MNKIPPIARYSGRYPDTMKYLKAHWRATEANAAMFLVFCYYYRRGENGQDFAGFHPYCMSAEEAYRLFDSIIEGEQKIRNGISQFKPKGGDLLDTIEVSAEPLLSDILPQKLN